MDGAGDAARGGHRGRQRVALGVPGTRAGPAPTSRCGRIRRGSTPARARGRILAACGPQALPAAVSDRILGAACARDPPLGRGAARPRRARRRRDRGDRDHDDLGSRSACRWERRSRGRRSAARHGTVARPSVESGPRRVPSSAAVAGVGLLAMLAAARGARSGTWIAVGVAAGVSATLRIPNVLVLLPVAVVLLCACGGTSSERMRGVIHVAVGALVGLLPLLVQNWCYFGSPFATGYGYWVPGTFFATRYALGPPVSGGSDPNALFYARALLGKGELYGWPVAALVGVGAFLGMRRPGGPRALAILAVAYAGALYAFQSVFFWQSERFLLPAVPLLTALAALPLSALAGRVVRVTVDARSDHRPAEASDGAGTCEDAAERGTPRLRLDPPRFRRSVLLRAPGYTPCRILGRGACPTWPLGGVAGAAPPRAVGSGIALRGPASVPRARPPRRRSRETDPRARR